MSDGSPRSGRAKPAGGGWELAIWYLIRLSGLGLFVLALAHFSITHFVFDPCRPEADWILDDAGAASCGGPSTGSCSRWSSSTASWASGRSSATTPAAASAPP